MRFCGLTAYVNHATSYRASQVAQSGRRMTEKLSVPVGELVKKSEINCKTTARSGPLARVCGNAVVRFMPISDIMSGKPRSVSHTTTPRKSVVRRAFRCPVDRLRLGVGAACWWRWRDDPRWPPKGLVVFVVARLGPWSFSIPTTSRNSSQWSDCHGTTPENTQLRHV